MLRGQRERKKLFYMILVVLFYFFSPSAIYAKTELNSYLPSIDFQPRDPLTVAKQYINENKGGDALTTIKPLLDVPTFDVLIVAAQAYAELNNPPVALDFYKKARLLGKTDVQRQIADAGIKKMQMWVAALKPVKPVKPIVRSNPLIDSAKIDINAGNGKQALSVLKPLLSNHPSYLVLMLAAQGYAEINKPSKSLDYYKQAYLAAGSQSERRSANFGIAKMQFWLARYYRAQHTYERILKDTLDKDDEELALAGKVKSLAYEDRPILGYNAIPKELIFSKPEMVIAAAQASLWSDWADITYKIVNKYDKICKRIPKKSPLSKELKDLTWQMNQAVWPNSLNPGYFFSGDSEDFRVNRGWVDYSRYWSQTFQSFVGLKYTSYSQYKLALNAKSVYVRQNWRPTRQLILRGQLEPSNFELWSPTLGLANVSYQPNDYVSVNVGSLREVVETFPAFAHHITDDQLGASLFLKPLPYVQLNGSLSKMSFSDSNDRNGYYVSASALVSPRFGLSLILQKRGYVDKFRSPFYFSPNHYVANTAILRLGSKAGSVWHYYIDGGLGNQMIEVTGVPAKYVPTHQWGVGMTGPIAPWLIVSAYYSTTNQASSFINTRNYWYQSGSVSLKILL